MQFPNVSCVDGDIIWCCNIKMLVSLWTHNDMTFLEEIKTHILTHIYSFYLMWNFLNCEDVCILEHKLALKLSTLNLVGHSTLRLHISLNRDQLQVSSPERLLLASFYTQKCCTDFLTPFFFSNNLITLDTLFCFIKGLFFNLASQFMKEMVSV